MDLVRALLAVLDALNQGVHVVDERGVTVIYNKEASRLDGLSASEVVGRPLLEVFPSLDQESSTLFKVLKTGIPEPERQQTFTNYKGQEITTLNFTHPISVGGKVVGACEISTDITNMKEMAERIVDLQRELKGREASRETGPAQSTVSRLFTFDDIVGESLAMKEVKSKASRVAGTDAPVLVWGETGTGKELLVQAIHSASRRSAGPFVPQNSAALPESLLEGLVFGTARGGFTGSMDRPGLVELASGGTLYLDEIDSMPLGLQAKLLRVIQDKRVRRLGDTRERPVNVRFVASTSLRPSEAVQRGLLRADLYYRLAVVEIGLPPLRERREDIPLLCQHFLEKHAANGKARAVSPQVMAAFLTYEWPGNVRELEHAIAGSLALARGTTVEVSDLPQAVRGILATASMFKKEHTREQEVLGEGAESRRRLKESLREQERQAIEDALRQGGSISQAARILGIPRQTLQYRMRVLGIGRP